MSYKYTISRALVASCLIWWGAMLMVPSSKLHKLCFCFQLAKMWCLSCKFICPHFWVFFLAYTSVCWLYGVDNLFHASERPATAPWCNDAFHHKLVLQPRKHRMKGVEFLSIFSEKQDWSSRPAHPAKSKCTIKSALVQPGYPPKLMQFKTANVLVVRGDAMTAAATYSSVLWTHTIYLVDCPREVPFDFRT